ncbi:Fic family protein [Alloscardovia macacae]|uniref:protein adenylyltransferase n=1 Tax=Alloscardovia macacae TaxID=1160091 RepID=A0A261F230_9BIFI|nr:Fic family protein [Alloscardovia macacae]OZG53125.1 cell filamentation protein [Alloscardovia macacae]
MLTYAWKTGIGLQDVDGLQVSVYLRELAEKQSSGELSFGDVRIRLDEYSHTSGDNTYEADWVALHIAERLSDDDFSLSTEMFLNIHRELFTGVRVDAGALREYNISKKEWVLGGQSVRYAAATELADILEYDMREEKSFSYAGLTPEKVVSHLARFTANIWQIHPFAEGNTRTTAVFLILYARSLGFRATNDAFAQHAWYFRNALVRANFSDVFADVTETREYLESFLQVALLGEERELTPLLARMDSVSA